MVDTETVSGPDIGPSVGSTSDTGSCSNQFDAFCKQTDNERACRSEGRGGIHPGARTAPRSDHKSTGAARQQDQTDSRDDPITHLDSPPALPSPRPPTCGARREPAWNGAPTSWLSSCRETQRLPYGKVATLIPSRFATQQLPAASPLRSDHSGVSSTTNEETEHERHRGERRPALVSRAPPSFRAKPFTPHCWRGDRRAPRETEPTRSPSVTDVGDLWCNIVAQ